MSINKGTTQKQVDKMKALIEGGMSYPDVGEKFNLCSATVRYHVNKIPRVPGAEKAPKIRKAISGYRRESIQKKQKSYRDYFEIAVEREPGLYSEGT